MATGSYNQRRSGTLLSRVPSLTRRLETHQPDPGGMPMKLKPLGDRLIVQAVEEEETTASGIVLPDTAKEKPHQRPRRRHRRFASDLDRTCRPALGARPCRNS